MIVWSEELRKKLASRENAAINNGDTIELIHGHHLFKYVSSSSSSGRKRSYSETNSDGENPKLAAKIMQNQGKTFPFPSLTSEGKFLAIVPTPSLV
ncbi:hypothetical protein F3Y22_tig00110348pilonHSYRG00372 [Hibiscus syriacus]|uniref:Uncharacterized protein n=1 Tax=Hibiscus syriacus TaxID=106335 RepID=A0A6A3AZ14_HIBSY|nr:hypothetical protein F3Y22_tig00110348pilonHSYRG00372 [Hibiscus syriacus]